MCERAYVQATRYLYVQIAVLLDTWIPESMAGWMHLLIPVNVSGRYTGLNDNMSGTAHYIRYG